MAAPSPQAELVMAFANTIDLEDETDELSSPSSLSKWLSRMNLVGSPPTVTARDLSQCLRLRSGVREALAADGLRPHVLADADSALRDFPLLVSTTSLLRSLAGERSDVLVAEPELPALQRALSTLAASLAVLLVTGENQRVKRCPMENCGWVFWDSSKNLSRRWCSMRVCGNRAKARSYAARHHQ